MLCQPLNIFLSWMHISEWPVHLKSSRMSLRMTNQEQNTQMCKKPATHLSGQLLNTPWILWHGWDQACILLRNLKGQALCYAKFVPQFLPLEQSTGMLMCAINFQDELVTTQFLALGSSQVIEFGFTATMYSLSNHYHSGRAFSHKDEWRHEGMASVKCNRMHTYLIFRYHGHHSTRICSF